MKLKTKIIMSRRFLRTANANIPPPPNLSPRANNVRDEITIPVISFLPYHWSSSSFENETTPMSDIDLRCASDSIPAN